MASTLLQEDPVVVAPAPLVMAPEAATTNQFMSWRDMVVTPAVETLLVALAGLVTWQAHVVAGLGTFATVVIFGVSLVFFTLVALRVIRAVHPLNPGVYSRQRNPVTCYVWNLYGFLCITNLSFQYISGLLPVLSRKAFYGWMGARFGRGIISIGGRITEPWLVSVGENAIIGDDALILGHALTSSGAVVLGRVEIGAGAVVGAKSVVMPGVRIGTGSMINAMSFVPMHTDIPAYEVWGGNPVQKVRELPRPALSTTPPRASALR